jgi:hypothetical protein
MRAPTFRHFIHAGAGVVISGMLLGATAGFAAAAPGGHGRGPFGQSQVGAAASDTDNTRPGWGCGDRNHVHTGPPGLGAGATSPCGSRTGTGNTEGVHLVISAPASVAADTAFTFTVTAENQSNNVVSSFGDTLHFSSSDGAALLPGDSSLTNGTGSFSAVLRTGGTQTLTATDTSNGSITATATIAVGAAAAVHFAVVPASSNVTAGTAFTFTVTAQDSSNATVTSYSGTVHFTSSDASASLPADSTLTNGTGMFSATLRTAGNQTITGTDTSNSAITGSGMVTVAPAAATHLAVSAPSSATHGTAFTFTVTAQDQFNNTATSYGGSVHFTSSDGSASLPANSGLTNGSGSFSATLNTAGNQTITATDTSNSSITGTSGTIAVS